MAGSLTVKLKQTKYQHPKPDLRLQLEQTRMPGRAITENMCTWLRLTPPSWANFQKWRYTKNQRKIQNTNSEISNKSFTTKLN